MLSVLPLLFLAAPALAQDNGSYQDPYAAAAGARGYWGYNDPLTGYANLLNAQGKFLINIQQAKMLGEAVQQEKLNTRRKEIEHWDWQRKFVPRALEEQRVLRHDERIRDIVRDAPPAELYSGAVLNTLFKELNQQKLTADSSVPVEQEWLAHIHVTSANGSGNPGLLKADKIAWPLLLLGRADLAEERTQIEQLLTRCKQSVLKKHEPTADILELRRRVDSLVGKLREEVRAGGAEDWSPGQYVAAIRSLTDLKDVLVLLERPDADFYFVPLKGKKVADLVQYMKANGLIFAAATTGDERFYTAVYYALREELKSVGGVPSLSPNP
jgi:hypothetical protein